MQPLGLRSTGLDVRAAFSGAQNAALSYLRNGSVNGLAFQDIGWIGPAGQAYASAADLQRVARDLLAGASGLARPKLYADSSIYRDLMRSSWIDNTLHSGFGELSLRL